MVGNGKDICSLSNDYPIFVLTGSPIQFSTDNKDCMKLLKVFFYILIPAYLIYDIIAGVSFFLDESVADSWKDSYLILLFVLVFYLFILIIGLYSIHSFYRRKTDAVFIAKHLLIYALVFRFLVVLTSPSLLLPYIPLMITVFLLVFVCIAADIKEQFPQEKRKIRFFTWVLFFCSIITSPVLLFFGVLQMLSNLSI